MTESPPTKPALLAFDPQNCQIYAASCHCGSVQYSVLLSPPLAKWKVVSCNCSICTRNGYLLVYPERSQLQVKSGEGMLRDYSFGAKRVLHRFCSRCGSAVWHDPRMEEFGDAPPDLLGVNVRDCSSRWVCQYSRRGADQNRFVCSMESRQRSWISCMSKIGTHEGQRAG
jgi:hypothetical protein